MSVDPSEPQALAMASKDPSSKETTNFARLSKVFVDVFCDLLRAVLDAKVAQVGLTTILKNQRKQLYKILDTHQRSVIYPDGKDGKRVCDLEDITFDVSLLYKLLRNIKGIGIEEHKNKWGHPPDTADRSLSANIERLRFLRNEDFAHRSTTKLSNSEFKSMWDLIHKCVEEIEEEALTGDTNVKAMDKIQDNDMDPETENEYIAKLISSLQKVTDRQETMEASLEAIATNINDNAIKQEAMTATISNRQEDMARDIHKIQEDVTASKVTVNTTSANTGPSKEDVTASKVTMNTTSANTGPSKDSLILKEKDLRRLASCFGSGWEMFVGQLGVGSEQIDRKKQENTTNVLNQIFGWFQQCKTRPTIKDFDQILQQSKDLCSVNIEKYEDLKTEIENRK